MKQLAALLVLDVFVFGSTVSSAGDFDDPFASRLVESEQKEWTPEHPTGKTPYERMQSLVYTEALPSFDRAVLYSLYIPDPKKKENLLKESSKDTFPIKPYRSHAKVTAHVTLEKADCDSLRKAWQSMTFDSIGGAFCHYPAYGMRLYRDDQLLFETSVCFACQNFYLPSIDLKEKTASYRWYGFASDENSKKLYQLLHSKFKSN